MHCTPQFWVDTEELHSRGTTTMEREALGFSKLLVSIYKSTECHSPEDNNMYFYHCINLSLAVKTMLCNQY